MAQQFYTPYGFRDILFEEAAARREIEQVLGEIFERYGYRSILTPTVEYLELFGEERGSIAPRDMYKFIDKDGELLVLRPDMTPAVARTVASYFKEADLPLRIMTSGITFRYNSRYSAKQRELRQMGVELFGDCSVQSDAEVISLGIESLLAAGLQDFRIAIGHSKVVPAILDVLEGYGANRKELAALIESKNFMGLAQQTQALALPQELGELVELLTEAGGAEVIEKGRRLSEEAGCPAILQYFERACQVHKLLCAYGVDSYLIYDMGMTAQLGYYTGLVFKGYAAGSSDNVLDGGRYDDLLKQFDRPWPAVGFAIYQDSLIRALRSQQKLPQETKRYLAVSDAGGEGDMIDWVQRWRNEGKVIIMRQCIADVSGALQYAKNHSCSKVLFYLHGQLAGYDVVAETQVPLANDSEAGAFLQ